MVDDDVDAAQGLRMLLELKGHDVDIACDGPGALALIERAEPEAVLLDLGLPGMDGAEVARRTRSLPGGALLRIVAVTGWGQDEDRLRMRDAGFDAHLTKPVSAVTLDEVLAQAPPQRHREV